MSALRSWIRENVTDPQVRALGNRLATEIEKFDQFIADTEAHRQDLAEWRDELRAGLGLPPDDASGD